MLLFFIIGRITFENYLYSVSTFLCGSTLKRLDLCFRFFDLGRKGKVTYSDLVCVFVIIHALYQGNEDDHKAATQQAHVFAQLICDKVCFIVHSSIIPPYHYHLTMCHSRIHPLLFTG